MDKYFIYDPENGFETFETIDARKTDEKETIASYLEDGYGWSEDVEYVVTGVITHKATKCDVKNKPPESELDENGDYEYICNYEMKEIEKTDNIGKIIEMMLQEAEKETHADKVACLYAVLSRVDMAVGKQMMEMRNDERNRSDRKNSAWARNEAGRWKSQGWLTGGF